MRSQAERDEETLVIGTGLALLVAVIVLTTVGAFVGLSRDVEVGLAGMLAGTVAMMAGAVAIAALAMRGQR